MNFITKYLGIIKIIAVLALIGSLIGGLFALHHHIYKQGYAAAEAIYQKREADATVTAQKQVAADNEKIRTLQAQITAVQADLSNKQTELQHAKTHADSLQSDLLASKQRLHTLVTVTSKTDPTQQTNGASATRLGSTAEVAADLDPTVAAGLVKLTETGDSAIIRLNACIEAYDAIKAASDAQP